MLNPLHEECMLATSRVLHLVETYSWCYKKKSCSILWAIVSSSTSWILHSIQLKLLVNMCHYTYCHKHTVVPSVASGKSVKSRTPFICCSVVLVPWMWTEEFWGFPWLVSQSSQLWIMYSVTSAFSECGLHSSGVNSKTSLIYCLKSNGHTNFPKV